MVEEPVLLLATAMEDQVSTLLLSPPLHHIPAPVTTPMVEEFLEVLELHHLHREEMTPAPVLVLMKREALVVLPPSTREV